MFREDSTQKRYTKFSPFGDYILIGEIISKINKQIVLIGECKHYRKRGSVSWIQGSEVM